MNSYLSPSLCTCRLGLITLYKNSNYQNLELLLLLSEQKELIAVMKFFLNATLKYMGVLFEWFIVYTMSPQFYDNFVLLIEIQLY